MTLIACPDCNRSISTKAQTCVGCGLPLTRIRLCPECGDPCDIEASGCPSCGFRLSIVSVDRGQRTGKSSIIWLTSLLAMAAVAFLIPIQRYLPGKLSPLVNLAILAACVAWVVVDLMPSLRRLHPLKMARPSIPLTLQTLGLTIGLVLFRFVFDLTVGQHLSPSVTDLTFFLALALIISRGYDKRLRWPLIGGLTASRIIGSCFLLSYAGLWLAQISFFFFQSMLEFALAGVAIGLPWNLTMARRVFFLVPTAAMLAIGLIPSLIVASSFWDYGPNDPVLGLQGYFSASNLANCVAMLSITVIHLTLSYWQTRDLAPSTPKARP